MTVPHFIIIGAMKSGTTTLHEYLNKHPEIYMCSPKEPQYFSRMEKYKKGVEWYESLFSGASKSQVCGEASTCYSRWPTYGDVPRRIFEYAENMKFIYIMRSPVRQAYSHYVHSILVDGCVYDSFRAALEKNQEILDTCMYMMQIKQYLEYYTKDSFLFIKFEEFVKDPNPVLTLVQKFIGVTEYNLTINEDLVANRAGDGLVNEKLSEYIRFVRRIPILSILITHIFTSKQRENIRQVFINLIQNSLIGTFWRNRIRNNIDKLEGSDKEYILNKCRSDIQELEFFTGLDLSDWYSNK